MIDIDALKRDKRPQSSAIVHALLDRLEAAEKDIAIKEEVIDSLAAVVKRLDAQCDAAEAEAIEQARLNGMGSEREAALLSKLEAAEKERDDFAQQLVQSEQGKRKISEECDTLRVKIAAMESALWAFDNAWRTKLTPTPGAKGE